MFKESRTEMFGFLRLQDIITYLLPNNNLVMKNEESITFKIDKELFTLFKDWCDKERTTMSRELRGLLVNLLIKKDTTDVE